MYTAIKQGDFEKFIECLEKDEYMQHYWINGGLCQPLHIACESAQLQMVTHLIAVSQVDINAKCRLTGYTPFMYACQVGDRKIIEYLLSQTDSKEPVDLEAKSVYGRTALQILEESGINDLK